MTSWLAVWRNHWMTIRISYTSLIRFMYTWYYTDCLIGWMFDALNVDTWYPIESLTVWISDTWLSHWKHGHKMSAAIIYWLWISDIWITDCLYVWNLTDSLTYWPNGWFYIVSFIGWVVNEYACWINLPTVPYWHEQIRSIQSRFHFSLYAAVLVTNKCCFFSTIFVTLHVNSTLNSRQSTSIELMSKSVLTAARVLGSLYSDDMLFIQIRYTQPNIVLFENHVRTELRIIFCFTLEQFRRAFILIHVDNSRK
jgi:hypothetical protein